MHRRREVLAGLRQLRVPQVTCGLNRQPCCRLEKVCLRKEFEVAADLKYNRAKNNNVAVVGVSMTCKSWGYGSPFDVREL